MSARIREAQIDDVSVIVEFNQRLASETEGKTLDSDILQPGVEALLRDPQKGFYIVAEHDDEVIGQLMITREWSDWRNGWMWWIQSVYVRMDSRRQGVFRQLYRHIQQQAQERDDVVGIRLYVEKDNHSAQKTYFSMEMEDTGYLIMEQLTT